MMHRRFKVKISAGGAVLLAALYFLLDTDELAALLLAAAAHELGHLVAIRLTGGRARSLTANITGAVIERDAQAGSLSEMVCALSGPAAGLIWAALAAGLGSFIGLDMLLLSAGMSLVLSGFNLLPGLPLDGGRALECAIGCRATLLCSLVTAALVLLFGVILAASGGGMALLIAGGTTSALVNLGRIVYTDRVTFETGSLHGQTLRKNTP